MYSTYINIYSTILINVIHICTINPIKSPVLSGTCPKMPRDVPQRPDLLQAGHRSTRWTAPKPSKSNWGRRFIVMY